MKIAIVGAGAMGSLYGGYLSNAGQEVYLIDVWSEHVNKINDIGLKILEKDSEVVVHPKAVINSKEIGDVDLVITFVKSIHTGKAIEQNMRLIGPETMVLSLQNGYGNIEAIEQFVKSENIIAGTTAHGATMLGPGEIRHAGNGETHIGSALGKKDERIDNIAAILEKSGFETSVSDNVMELIWGKLIINVGINALTALLKVKNGMLNEMIEIKELMKLAVVEAISVADKLGIKFDEESTIKKVMKVADMTGENKSSMLQDILNKRKTEIDTINGAIVKEGIKLAVDTPVNKVLTNLIKAVEKTY